MKFTTALNSVPDVGEDVVEVCDGEDGGGAEEVVVADVLVAGGLEGGLLVEDHLNGRDGVEDAHGHEEPDVQVGLLKHGRGRGRSLLLSAGLALVALLGEVAHVLG